MRGLILFLFLSLNAYGVTEKEIIRSVLEHFPVIEASEFKVQAAEGELTSSKGSFDTKLKFKLRDWNQEPYYNEYFQTTLEKQTALYGAKVMAGHRQGSGYFNYYDLKKETSSAGQIFAGIVMPVLRNFSTDSYRTNRDVNELKKKMAEQNLRVKKLIYVHKALSLYYKWMLQTKKIEISRHLLALAEKRQSMISRKFKAGDAERLKVTDNLRAMDKRRADLNENKILLQEITNELSLYLRNEEGRPIVLSEAKNPEEVLKLRQNSSGSSLTESNPQLQILSYEMKIIEKQNKLAEQSKLPGLSFDVTGFKELSQRPDYGQHILQLGISFDFPLENRKAEGKSVATHYKEKALEKELRYLGQELSQKLRFSISASELSHDRWEITNREYKNTEKVVNGERKKWLQGASDLFQVNIREQDLADVDKRRWAALYEYHQHYLDARLYSASLPID